MPIVRSSSPSSHTLALGFADNMINELFRQPWYVLMPRFVAFWAVTLLAFWAAPFLSLQFKQQGADRMMSLTNAIICTGLGCYLLFYFTETKCSVDELDYVGSGMTLVCTSYLFVDIFSMIYCDVIKGWRPVDLASFVHHSLIIVGGLVVALQHIELGWFAGVLLVTEASTVPHNFIWIAAYNERKDTMFYLACITVFALTFMLCRIVFLPVMLWCWCVKLNCTPGYFMLIFCSLLLALNAYWFSKIMWLAIRKAASMLPSEEERIAIGHQDQVDKKDMIAEEGETDLGAGAEDGEKKGDGGLGEEEGREAEGPEAEGQAKESENVDRDDAAVI